ncbi:Retrovirus-related Pol polyprotein from transposon TNT 1-94 [Includes: Protease [Durusdinium trenchii]|uniref:Retrovirus-related Pol polyprotein from transposon TNT 1-94 n=1 Tax=Durusdinium trenchii TaxID=1381693 RepID=A0ABP0RBK6_9DINO
MVAERLVGRPNPLGGSIEEASRDWRQWSYRLELWLSSQFPDARTLLGWARDQGDTKITLANLESMSLPSQVQRETLLDFNRQLELVLGTLTTGSPGDIAMNSSAGSGLDMFRRLHSRLDPTDAVTSMRILRTLMSTQAVSGVSELVPAIERWEDSHRRYAQRKGCNALDEQQRIVSILGLAPPALSAHLELNMSRLTTYDAMRREMVSYAETRRALTTPADSGATPTEIDALKGAKSRGKGRGGNGKGARQQITCYVCNKKGHMAKDCWQRQDSEKDAKKGSKGKKGKGKGKTGKAHEVEGDEGHETYELEYFEDWDHEVQPEEDPDPEVGAACRDEARQKAGVRNRSPRFAADIAAGCNPRQAWRKEKSRQRAADNRQKSRPDRAADRIQKDNDWHEKFTAKEGRKLEAYPLIPNGDLIAAPLTRKEKQLFRQEDADKELVDAHPRDWTRATQWGDHKADEFEEIAVETEPEEFEEIKVESEDESPRPRLMKSQILDRAVAGIAAVTAQSKKKAVKPKWEAKEESDGLLNHVSGQRTASVPCPKPTQYECVQCTLDSGATHSVLPVATLDILPLLKPEGPEGFRTASGAWIPNIGSRKFTMVTQDGKCLKAAFHVADVWRPLLSATQCAKAGNTITMNARGAIITNDKTDGMSKAIFSHLLPAKGTQGSTYPEKAVLKDLNFLGYRRLVLKHDQEPSIKALARTVKAGFEGEVLPEESPKGDAHGQSNGAAERAVQTCQGLVRTLKAHLERPIGSSFSVLAWMVEHAGTLHTLYSQEGAEGLTPFQRIKGGGTPYRRLYIRQADLEFHGYTGGYDACAAIREGRNRSGILHSEHCRKRVIEALGTTDVGRLRLEREKEKEELYIAKVIEEDDKKRKQEAQPKQQEDKSEKKRATSLEAPQAAILPPPNPGGASSSSGQSTDSVARPKRKGGEADDSLRAEEREQLRSAPQKRKAEEPEAMLESLIHAQREAYIGTLASSRPTCDWEDGLSQEQIYQTFYDDRTGKELPAEGVRAARAEEISVIRSMGVWQVIDRPKNEPVIGTRWLDVNKGDELRMKLRSGLVAQELRRKKAGPDGKLRPVSVSGEACILFLDVKKAHFWSPIRRRLLVKLLPEAGESPNKVGLLKKSLYGTRDAPSNWEHAIKVVFEACGFTQGLSNPCIYFHEERQLYANVHGDDFTVVGDFHQLQWLVNTLKASWTLDVRGILARPGSGLPASEVIHSISVLNRLVTWTEKGIEMEADPRHVQLVLQQLNLEAATPVATPLVKTKPGEENDTPLSTSEAATYRSTAMRLGYLSLDRPDLLRTVRELAKGLEEPTMHHWSMLKRAARYLRGCARLVQLIPHQNSFTTVLGWSDSDHAGCVRSRKSTTGTVIQLGQSVIKAQAKGQAVIALSTGEAEYYGLISTASAALGEQAMLQDWQIACPVVIALDASAGISIGSRRGLGRVKHIETCFLWAQDLVDKQRLRLRKIRPDELQLTTTDGEDGVAAPEEAQKEQTAAAMVEAKLARMFGQFQAGVDNVQGAALEVARQQGVSKKDDGCDTGVNILGKLRRLKYHVAESVCSSEMLKRATEHEKEEA